MNIKRFLNELPVASLENSVLHDDVIEGIIADVRERTEA